MTDAKKVRRLLRRNLGATAPIPEHLVDSLVNMINRSTPGVPPVVDLVALDDPSTFERFRKALKELSSATSELIVETTELLDFEPLAADARTTLVDLERLRAETDLALSRCGPVQRKPDRRARWHATARAFAMFIESGYQAAGMASPSRSHIASPLVKAVRDLLAELDIACTPDQVAKVLHADTPAQRKKPPG